MLEEIHNDIGVEDIFFFHAIFIVIDDFLHFSISCANFILNISYFCGRLV